MYTTHVLYASNNTALYFFLELNSSFAQFYTNVQNIPRLALLHNAAFCVVLVNLIFNVLLFLVLTRVVIVTIIHFKKNDNRLDGKRLASLHFEHKHLLFVINAKCFPLVE